MKIGVVTKARIGFAIGIGMLIGIGEAEACGRIELLQRYVTAFCLFVGGAGFVGWVLGQIFQRKRMKVSEVENPFIFLKSLRYWGLILIVSTAGFYSRSALRHPSVMVVEAKPAAVFPALELEGLVLNGAKSSALINGHVLFVGDGIGNVQLLSIEGDHATVGLEGQTKVLTLKR